MRLCRLWMTLLNLYTCVLGTYVAQRFGCVEFQISDICFDLFKLRLPEKTSTNIRNLKYDLPL